MSNYEGRRKKPVMISLMSKLNKLSIVTKVLKVNHAPFRQNYRSSRLHTFNYDFEQQT